MYSLIGRSIYSSTTAAASHRLSGDLLPSLSPLHRQLTLLLTVLSLHLRILQRSTGLKTGHGVDEGNGGSLVNAGR